MLSATPFGAFCECKDKPKFLFCKIFPQKSQAARLRIRPKPFQCTSRTAITEIRHADTIFHCTYTAAARPTRCATRRRAPRSAYPARPHSGSGNRLPGNSHRRHRAKTQRGRRGSTVDAVGPVDQFRGRNVAAVQMQKHILHRRRRLSPRMSVGKSRQFPPG